MDGDRGLIARWPEIAGAWSGDWERGTPRTAPNIQHRHARLSGLGNAVVPEVAEMIGRWIVAHAEGA